MILSSSPIITSKPYLPEETWYHVPSEGDFSSGVYSSSAFDIAPIWQADSTVDRCNKCDLPFSTMRRRHHCRFCGKIFCASCCSRQGELPAKSIVYELEQWREALKTSFSATRKKSTRHKKVKGTSEETQQEFSDQQPLNRPGTQASAQTGAGAQAGAHIGVHTLQSPPALARAHLQRLCEQCFVLGQQINASRRELQAQFLHRGASPGVEKIEFTNKDIIIFFIDLECLHWVELTDVLLLKLVRKSWNSAISWFLDSWANEVNPSNAPRVDSQQNEKSKSLLARGASYSLSFVSSYVWSQEVKSPAKATLTLYHKQRLWWWRSTYSAHSRWALILLKEIVRGLKERETKYFRDFTPDAFSGWLEIAFGNYHRVHERKLREGDCKVLGCGQGCTSKMGWEEFLEVLPLLPASLVNNILRLMNPPTKKQVRCSLPLVVKAAIRTRSAPLCHMIQQVCREDFASCCIAGAFCDEQHNLRDLFRICERKSTATLQPIEALTRRSARATRTETPLTPATTTETQPIPARTTETQPIPARTTETQPIPTLAAETPPVERVGELSSMFDDILFASLDPPSEVLRKTPVPSDKLPSHDKGTLKAAHKGQEAPPKDEAVDNPHLVQQILEHQAAIKSTFAVITKHKDSLELIVDSIHSMWPVVASRLKLETLVSERGSVMNKEECDKPMPTSISEEDSTLDAGSPPCCGETRKKSRSHSFRYSGVRFDAAGCNLVYSASRPFVGLFSHHARSFRILFKSTPVVKDLLVVSLVRLCESILEKELGIKFDIVTFNVIPAVDRTAGLIEIVPGAITLQDVKDVHDVDLLTWIQNRNRDLRVSEIRARFVRSASFWCTWTYLLSVQDRHMNNLLVTESGFLLHCDFEKILQENPPVFDFSAIRVTPAMVAVMGGESSVDYLYFKDSCLQIYNCLRKHLSLFTAVVEFLVEEKVLALDLATALNRLHTTFKPHVPDRLAALNFKDCLDQTRSSYNSYSDSLGDLLHFYSNTVRQSLPSASIWSRLVSVPIPIGNKAKKSE